MNLTVINEQDGSVSAHRAGCADVPRQVKRFRLDHYTQEYASQREAFLDYNADFIDEADGDESNSYLIDFKPCTKGLPTA